MQTIKQEKGSKDCLACVAAMATETTVEQFKEYYTKNNLPFDSDLTFIMYLWEMGYMVGTFAAEEKLFTFSDMENVNLLGGKAYIIVESHNEWVRKQGAAHSVFWDGMKLYDPNPDIDIPTLKDYKIIMIINICKNANHPRWKKKDD